MRMGLTARQRLRRSTEFDAVRAGGKKGYGRTFVMQVMTTSPSGAVAGGTSTAAATPVRRLGVVASRRVGNAVARNRAKRVLREVFRQNQRALPPSSDTVLTARRALLEAPFEQVRSDFLKQCQRLR